MYDTHITFLYTNNQGYTFSTTKPRSNNPYHKFILEACSFVLYVYYFIWYKNNITFSYIDTEITGNYNEWFYPFYDIHLSKGICNINTLTLQTYNTFSKAALISPRNTDPLDNMYLRVQETLYYWHPLSQNSITWV